MENNIETNQSFVYNYICMQALNPCNNLLGFSVTIKPQTNENTQNFTNEN